MVDGNERGGLFGRLIGGKRSRRNGRHSHERGVQQQPLDVHDQPEDRASSESQTSQPDQPPVEQGNEPQPAPPVEKVKPIEPSAEAASSEPDRYRVFVPQPETGPATPLAASGATTSLLFQPPVLPERPDRGDGDQDEYPQDEADHAEAGTRQEPGTSRRRRRRGGQPNAAHGTADGEPRAETVVSSEPTKLKGSTRLEAKKQRRNASRDAGRRRSSVTEVEFQARREAVDRKMIVRSGPDLMQIGVLEDDILVEHYIARSKDLSLIGNVYLGRVQNVLPSMEAAFVDIGRGRNAVLYSGEVDWDAAEVHDKQRRIEQALKPGDLVLVQVTKDPVGHKGARLTSQISLPGRYLVYVPGGSMNGISRKLPDTERGRLKKILKEILPEHVGVIVRTAAEGATKEQLEFDVQRLQRQWAEIQRLQETSQAPALLHSEPNLLVKIVRDVFNEDITKLVVSGDEAEETIDKYLHTIAPDLVDRVEKYRGEQDIFDAYRIEEQLQKAFARVVYLPSGGSLVIDRTEAMTVIDVNTGKFVGSGGNLEETVTKNNLEAAEEIVRQLRLRDLGGIVVVDFIDMVLESNRDLVMRRLIECLGRDRTKHQVAEVTSLGLIQMTRKKLGIGLAESFKQLDEQPGSEGRDDDVSGRARKQHGKRKLRATAVKKLNPEVTHAVAQIAASTIAAHTHAVQPDGAATASAEDGAVVASHQDTAGKVPSEASDDVSVSGDTPASQASTGVLDGLPEPKRAQSPHSRGQAGELLADVLAHLPEGNDVRGDGAQRATSKRVRRSRRASLPTGAASVHVEAPQDETGGES